MGVSRNTVSLYVYNFAYVLFDKNMEHNENAVSFLYVSLPCILNRDTNL